MSKKTKRIIGVSILAALIIALIYFAFVPVLIIVLPFVIAYLIARIIDPAVRFFNEKIKIPRKIASVFMILITAVILGGIITFVGTNLVKEIKALIYQRNEIISWLQDTWLSIAGFMQDKFGDSFNIFINENINFSKISSYVLEYAKPILQGTVSFAVSLPSVLLFIVVTVMSTYFISSDRELVSRTIYRSLPKKLRAYFLNMNKELAQTLLAYLRAQLIMLCITFAELTIGFTLMGGGIADYAIILAIAIALIDVLPVFGTGAVLIPWSVYMLITGNYKLAVCLILLYVVCLVVRQLVEPRIVSRQIGIHPLITLFAMYVGAKLIGVFGLILGPILAVIIKKTADAGVFADLWRYINIQE